MTPGTIPPDYPCCRWGCTELSRLLATSRREDFVAGLCWRHGLDLAEDDPDIELELDWMVVQPPTLQERFDALELRYARVLGQLFLCDDLLSDQMDEADRWCAESIAHGTEVDRLRKVVADERVEAAARLIRAAQAIPRTEVEEHWMEACRERDEARRERNELRAELAKAHESEAAAKEGEAYWRKRYIELNGDAET